MGKPIADSGLQESEVQTLLEQAAATIDNQLASLRQTYETAKRSQEQADVEQRQLDQLMEELTYHRQFAGRGKASVEDDPLAPYLEDLIKREGELRQRRDQLQTNRDRLGRLCGKMEMLIRLLETSSSYLLRNETSSAVLDDPMEAALRLRLVQGQESERARLAREVHDGPAQILTHMTMALEFCEQLLRHQPRSVPQELVKLRGNAREGLRDIRRFIFNLRPPSLADAGLVPTVQRFIDDFREQCNLDVQVNAIATGSLSPDAELAVFRIVQESLRNVQKHANAAHVVVDIARLPDGATLMTIKDDGKGFDASASTVGAGLVSMRERAELIGGKLNINSRPGYGTELTLLLPTSEALGMRLE
jgi:two-component system, NarL family, sensor histidine kinase DegS